MPAVRVVLALVALVLAGVPISAAAQGCAGDCNADGAVAVNELVAGVRIGLGDDPISQCLAFDVVPDGTLRIDELVLGVTAALTGCPATPTPSDTATASPTPTDTPTPTESPTPSATPTVPAVSGGWREDPLAVTASTCAETLTTEFAAQLAGRGPCAQQVTATSDTAVTVVDCTERSLDGTLARDGTIGIVYPPDSQTVEGCTVTLATSATIPAAQSPTTAHYAFAISFAGACALEDCVIEAAGAWTRID